MKCRLVLGVAVAAILAGASPSATAQLEAKQKAPANCADLPAMKDKLAQAEAFLKDWPNLTRFREANAKLAPPAQNEQRVVFLGDSITGFWRMEEAGGFFPGKPYINRGISAQTTPQMLIRFRQDVIALQPKVVVILAGTNDLAGNTAPTTLAVIEDNLASMAELARAHGIRVVLSSVLPVHNYAQGSEGKPVMQTVKHAPEQIRELNARIKRYAVDNDAVYLDYFSVMVDWKGMLKEDLSDDGLHPNAKGYAVMTPLAEEAIRTVLKKSR